MRGMPLRGQPGENTCRPGDLDLTMYDVDDYCGQDSPDYQWTCTRCKDHGGQHVAGDGERVCAIWQPDGSDFHDYRESVQ